jgi:hypothetical protein
VVLGVDHRRSRISSNTKLDAGVTEDTQLSAQDWLPRGGATRT